MRDIDQGSKPGLDTLKDVRGKPKAAERKAALRTASTETWFSRSGLKRRMSRSSFFSADQTAGRSSPDAEEGFTQQQTLLTRLIWALCLVTVLCLGGAVFYVVRYVLRCCSRPKILPHICAPATCLLHKQSLPGFLKTAGALGQLPRSQA
jgi:hypothetical protein